VLDLYATGLHFLSGHCCDSIPEQTYFEVSVWILIRVRGSKSITTGAVVSMVLSSSNPCCSLSPHSHLPIHSFLVCANSRLAVLLKPSLNLLYKSQKPSKH